jgi:hypothetical protein
VNVLNADKYIGSKDYWKWRNFYYLLVLVAALNVFDLTSTFWLSSIYGLQVELNPIMRHLLGMGQDVAVAFKLGVLTLFLMLMPQVGKKNYHLAYSGTFVVALIYGVIFVLHLIAIYHSIGIV